MAVLLAASILGPWLTQESHLQTLLRGSQKEPTGILDYSTEWPSSLHKESSVNSVDGGVLSVLASYSRGNKWHVVGYEIQDKQGTSLLKFHVYAGYGNVRPAIWFIGQTPKDIVVYQPLFLSAPSYSGILEPGYWHFSLDGSRYHGNKVMSGLGLLVRNPMPVAW
jgi:hypothetical protein